MIGRVRWRSMYAENVVREIRRKPPGVFEMRVPPEHADGLLNPWSVFLGHFTDWEPLDDVARAILVEAMLCEAAHEGS